LTMLSPRETLGLAKKDCHMGKRLVSVPHFSCEGGKR